MSLVLANRSLTEMSFFHSVNSVEELNLLKGPPFDFYYTSLQYMFILEISKLIEKPPKQKSHLGNHSGIEKASLEILTSKDEKYQPIHDQIVIEIDLLRNSSLFKHIKKLRDKKFAHSDSDSEHAPLSIPRFGPSMVDELLILLKELYRIWGKVTFELGYDFDSKVPHWEQRTRNFIKYHAVYKKHYHDNLSRAINEGYILKQ
jgi:hypothetical protein